VEKKVEKKSSSSENTYTTTYMSLLKDNKQNYVVSASESVLQFFLEFSNVSKKSYSWNKSISSSQDMFTEGKLAFYIGRASELFKIEKMNPNLSFDVSKILQVQGAKVEKTFGEIYAMVINKRSPNISTAFSVLGLITSSENIKNLSTSLSLPPSIKSLIAQKPLNNAYLHTFFDSALISRTWIDVNKKQTDIILQDMVENTLSNSMSPSQAIVKASDQLELLLK
jgi:maltose-binding protein MalE